MIKTGFAKNAHIRFTEYVHFIYLAQLNAWTSETFYKKQSKKTVHYQIKRDRKVNGYQE